jgi:RNA polymerase sigma-70 factor, ECF subfamily
MDSSSKDRDFRERPGSAAIRLEMLIAAAKTGSDTALGRALNECRPRLLQVARRGLSPALRHIVGASDVVQDTFVNATKAFRVFRGERAGQFRNWLRRILANRIAEVVRRESGVRTDAPQALDNGGPRRVDALASEDQESPCGIAGTNEVGSLIRMALSRLPERDQQVLKLRFDEELSFSEVGKRLELSEDAARMLFMRAVNRLRRELANVVGNNFVGSLRSKG